MGQRASLRLCQELIGFFGLIAIATTPRALSAEQMPMVHSPSAQLHTQRVLGLTGARNFRDIGGYPATGSTHVRWGAVYRSNALGELTPVDAARVDALGLVSVIDLRTKEERDHAPSVWINPPVDMYVSPKQTLAPFMAGMLSNAQSGASTRAEMEKFYAQVPDIYHDEYSALFHRVALGRFPILVHCTAGKDRTGVAVAVLLRSIGVPLQTVIADYELTDKLVPASVMAGTKAAPTGGAAHALAQLPEESRVALWQSRAQYIRAALDSIDREYGSVATYLSRGLDLSDDEIAVIRKNLTR